MRILQLFTISAGATLALGLFTEAGAAERLQSVVRRASAPEAQTNASQAGTFRIAGTTVDADGKAVGGAVVECYQYGNGGSMLAPADFEVKHRVTTGTNGAFEFRVSPVSTVVVGRKPGLAPAWSQYWNLTKDMTEERLAFTPPTTLAGVVLDEADKPVPDAEVWVSSAYSERPMENGSTSYAYLSGKTSRDCFSTRTTADGKFIIQGFPTNAAADLAVSKPGKALRESPRDHIGPDTMRCRAGQEDIKLVVEPAGSIEGKVVAQETGQPLAGMRLRLRVNRPLYFGGGSREPTESGADGTFRLADVAAGSYRIRATFGTNPVPEWVAETASVTTEAGQITRGVQVTATRGGFLEVAVLGKGDHTPLKEVAISAFKEAYQAGASSGTNGLALLRLPPGEYRVSAYKENSRSEGTAATVETGRTNHIEIELSPPPKIVGVVRDPSGAPVPGLELSVFPKWGQNAGGVQTDAMGRYEMAWNPQRFGGSQQAFCLIARDVARNVATAQDIEEGTTTLDLSLEPGLNVAGRVEDVNGKPLSNATVRVYLWSGNSGSQFDDKPIRTDAQGRFEVTAMPPGRKYSLDATAKGYGSANQSIQEDAGTNRIELEPCVLRVADHKLAGEVVDADEKPVARAHVSIKGQGQPNVSVSTDDKGRFQFNEVCEGPVQISVSSQSSYGNARAEAGDTNVVIHLGVNQSYSVRETPKRPLLKGKPLPDLAGVELGGDAAPAGKPVLLCLFDLEQRPSRRFVKQLAEQHDALKQKGVTVLGLQATVTTADSFKEWKGANPVPFPVGRVAEKADKTKWASDADSLPWLILTDGDRRVTAEGFTLDELEAKLKGQTKP
jgi:protocatechuate 3,4-dioxygenase beta subunit